MRTAHHDAHREQFRKENGYSSMADCVATILPPESDDGAEKSFEEKLGIEGKDLKNPRPVGKKKNGNNDLNHTAKRIPVRMVSRVQRFPDASPQRSLVPTILLALHSAWSLVERGRFR